MQPLKWCVEIERGICVTFAKLCLQPVILYEIAELKYYFELYRQNADARQ